MLKRGLRPFLAVLMLGALPAAAEAASIDVFSTDLGGIRGDGTRNGASIFAGQTTPSFDPPVMINNWFLFDLGAASGMTVTGASLVIGATGTYLTGDATETYSVHDYSGSITDLQNGTGGAAVFNDLGGGTLYGSTDVATPGSLSSPMPGVTVDLAGAIADINAALGTVAQLFALGGSISYPVATQQFLWGATGGTPLDFAKLVLEVSDVVEPVPLPAGLPLMAGGLALLGLLGRRRPPA